MKLFQNHIVKDVLFLPIFDHRHILKLLYDLIQSYSLPKKVSVSFFMSNSVVIFIKKSSLNLLVLSSLMRWPSSFSKSLFEFKPFKLKYGFIVFQNFWYQINLIYPVLGINLFFSFSKKILHKNSVTFYS